MKTLVKLLVAIVLGGCLVPALPAALYTDGTATFTVTFVDVAGQYDRRVDAIWVTDSSGRFVKTLRKDAANRQQYLYKWAAARGSYTTVDGYSGATISSWSPVTVTWNCRGTNNAIVPDGDYRFYAEFTDRNNQGPWTTNGITFTKGTSGITLNPANVGANLIAMQIVYNPIITHDIAVRDLAPRIGYPSVVVPVQVTVTNQTSWAESFSVTLSNVTTGTLLGTQPVANLAGSASTNLVFNWDTTGVATGDYVLQAVAGPVAQETLTADNTLTATITVRDPIHDVGVFAVTTPFLLATNTTANVVVTVTNAGDFLESFMVTLTDQTTPRELGITPVLDVAPFTARNLNFPWVGTDLPLGYHRLVAVAEPIDGETLVANNTNGVQALVALGSETNVVIAKGSTWRYHDRGVDLTDTPWKETSYYDGAWSLGVAPLGYGDTWIRTNLYYGTNAARKYPTYYVRKKFYLDSPPASLTLRVLRDDGIVAYVNGTEALRDNMPAGPIGYTNYALTSVGSSDETNYFVFQLGATNVSLGENCLALELHQSDPESSDAGLDVQLSVVSAQLTRVHDVPVAELRVAGDALAGDRVPVSLTLTNRGNATETVSVFLKDLMTGQILGLQTVADLLPGGSRRVSIPWSSLGAAVGDHPLQAYTVVQGVTNLAGAATGTATIRGTGFGLNAVPALGAIGGGCAALTTASNLLLVGAGATLEVWDRSVPAAPTPLGSVRLPGVISGLAATGTWAFAACGPAGVQFVDLASPVHPLHRNTFNSSGNAHGVAVNGNYLYVADGVAGVRVLNIANRLAPTLAGAYYTEGPARALTVSSTRLSVLDQQKGLLLLNIADPATLTLLGAYAGFNAGQAVVATPANNYVVDGNNRFYSLYTLSASSPSLRGTLLLTNQVGTALALNGSTVYAAAGEAGVLVINAASAQPVLAATLPTPGPATALALDSSMLYVGVGLGGFQVYSLAAPLSPVLQGSYPNAVRGADVVIREQLAYVAGGESGVRIFSVTNPASPVVVGEYRAAAHARSLALSGTRAYVGEGQQGLKILDVADPAAPSLLGSYTAADLGYVRNVGVAGALVVASDGRHLTLLNAETPAAPARVGSYDAPAFVFALQVANGQAYLACGEAGLVIVQVTPAGLSFAGSYDTPGFASGVTVVGTTAYVADGPGGWLAVNVADPAAPVPITGGLVSGGAADVAASGNVLTVAGGPQTAVSLDVSTPLTPVTRNTFASLLRALRMSAEGLLIARAEDDAGLVLLSNSTDVDQDGMLDAWEQQIIDLSLATNGPIRTVWDVLPGDDFDHDGAANHAEYAAGTSPVDAGSKFVAWVPAAPTGPSVTLSWSSMAGRTYTIYQSTNLTAGFSVLLDNIPATAPLNTQAVPATASGAFYLIGVR